MTEGKVKVLANDVKNLTQALKGYYAKAFEQGKDLCASVGLFLKTQNKLAAKLEELKQALGSAKNLSQEVKARAEETVKEAEQALEQALPLKKALKEFEAASNVYKKNPTPENEKRVKEALKALEQPQGANKTLKDFVESCNPYKKYLSKRLAGLEA
ncbi:MAG: hypothetical protein GXO03_02255 [Aquificae bacterium]|nr:hypothetical protein [Aquificota bacterium]